MILLLMSMATAYITYVLTASELPFVVRVQDWVRYRWGEDAWQAYLSTCGWCMSFYTSAAVVWATALVVELPLPGLAWLSVAFASGFLLTVVDAISSYNLRMLSDIVNSEKSRHGGS